MKTQRWKNVPGQLYIEISVDEDGIWDCHNDIELPMLAPFMNGQVNLTVNFLCSGFYEPASMFGGPHNLGYPEEGEDERLLDSATLEETPLPMDVAKQIFKLYESQVEEAEVYHDYC